MICEFCVCVHANVTGTDKKNIFFVTVIFHKPCCLKNIKNFPTEYAANSKTEVKLMIILCRIMKLQCDIV